ncbi:MAG TPA: alpha/beta fold hydrolase [Steroidobacteraceae bacterium]|nr:alpha/beta fold hydrolase [Steroidobacteraceae bacterium]
MKTDPKHKARRPGARAKRTRHSAPRAARPAAGAEASAAGKSQASAALPEPTDAERAIQLEAAALTGGIATDDYLKDWLAWCATIAGEPSKQAALAQSALEKAVDTWKFVSSAAMGAPLPPRGAAQGFSDPSWGQWPFNVFAHAYSNWATWVQQAVELGAQGPASAASIGTGASEPDAAQAEQAARRLARLRFATQLLLDAASPANFLHMNPELVRKTVDESGQNLVRGLKLWLEDAQGLLGRKRPAGTERFRVGRDVAVTPGKVVFRNRLIELLQYSPQTDTVHAEPILITPAWIMKYYILDLSPRNSLVRYLVEQGHTVFMISWKNPTREEKELGLDDYVSLGFEAALETVNRIVQGRKVHAVGYCIGGTLLSIAAALRAGKGEQRLASVTLLAALTDFSEPGELSVFITPAQLAMLEALMHKAGVLESERMTGAFAMLRSRDLLWKPAVDSYLRGERAQPNDLMAWNADGTRMPWRMHNEYLNRLYLKNELAAGRFTVRGRPISLADLQLPMFVVGTETDHVAPWRAVYKARSLTRSPDYTFLLTSGGHNAGIVSGPSHPKRRHRMLTWSNAKDTLSPEEWLEAAPLHSDSWWPAWRQWLVERSSTRERARPVAEAEASTGAELQDAPGTYVFG